MAHQPVGLVFFEFIDENLALRRTIGRLAIELEHRLGNGLAERFRDNRHVGWDVGCVRPNADAQHHHTDDGRGGTPIAGARIRVREDS